MLGFWVDLGDELGEIGWLERAWFLRKKKGQCCGIQREKKEKFCWGILSGFQLSLSDGKKALEEVEDEAFIRTQEAAGRAEDFESLRHGHCS